MRSFIAVLGVVTLALCLASVVGASGQNTLGSKGEPKKDMSGKLPPSVQKNDKKSPPAGKGTTSQSKDKKGSDTPSQTKKGSDTKSQANKGTDTKGKDGTGKNSKGTNSKGADKTSKDKGPGTMGSKSQTDQKKGPLYYRSADNIKNAMGGGNIKADAGQKTAMSKLVAGQQQLTNDERQQLTNLLFKGSQSGLTSDNAAALSYLLTEDMARKLPEGESTPSATVKPSKMSIRVINKTNEPIKLYLQVVAREPGQPPPDKEVVLQTLEYDLQPGKGYDLLEKGKGKEKLFASTVRYWAVSPTQVWVNNRDRDLALTPTGTSNIFQVTLSEVTATTVPAGGDGSKGPQN